MNLTVSTNNDLIVVVDYSKKNKKIYCIVTIEWSKLNILKTKGAFFKHVSGIKEKHKRSTYIKRLPEKLKK